MEREREREREGSERNGTFRRVAAGVPGQHITTLIPVWRKVVRPSFLNIREGAAGTEAPLPQPQQLWCKDKMQK